MIDYHETLVGALEMILPTHYEMVLHKGIKTPCISYMEISNVDDEKCAVAGYSRVSYQVKVWDTNLDIARRYAKEVDVVMRGLGFDRISSAELYDPNSTMIQKVMTYETLGFETY